MTGDLAMKFRFSFPGTARQHVSSVSAMCTSDRDVKAKEATKSWFAGGATLMRLCPSTGLLLAMALSIATIGSGDAPRACGGEPSVLYIVCNGGSAQRGVLRVWRNNVLWDKQPFTNWSYGKDFHWNNVPNGTYTFRAEGVYRNNSLAAYFFGPQSFVGTVVIKQRGDHNGIAFFWQNKP
jgi:hypothetical protein